MSASQVGPVDTIGSVMPDPVVPDPVVPDPGAGCRCRTPSAGRLLPTTGLQHAAFHAMPATWRRDAHFAVIGSTGGCQPHA
jgi:hypothetical protein